MNRLALSLFVLWGCINSTLAFGQEAIYRCDLGNGVIEYRNNGDTKACKKIVTQAVVSVQGPSHPKKATENSSAPNTRAASNTNNFPQVSNAAQKSRDNDRRAVLEQELQTENQRLASLQAEYRNGQPERQGNEKNYQKYLDRVAQMKDDISRSQANIAALQREISNLK